MAKRLGAGWRPVLPALVLALLALLSGRPLFLLVQPVLVNLAVAGAFGWSLRPGAMPLIERFARTFGEPPPGAPAHCRAFTWAWFVFGIVNAALSAWLAFAGDVDLWAAWTGPGSYAAIGLLFLVEWAVRRIRFGALPR